MAEIWLGANKRRKIALLPARVHFMRQLEHFACADSEQRGQRALFSYAKIKRYDSPLGRFIVPPRANEELTFFSQHFSITEAEKS